MYASQLHALALRETDIEGAIKRFSGDEELYTSCLVAFLDDPTMGELNEAIRDKSWDTAFTAAHALKGLAGNMGFVPLMHSIGTLVVLIRGGRVKDIGESLDQVNSCYRDICDAINQNFTPAGMSAKGELK